MTFDRDLPWEQIFRFLYQCGCVRDPRSFCIEVAQNLSSLVSFNQLRIHFFNSNGRSVDHYLFGVEKKWHTAYMNYFSYVDNQKYAIDLAKYPHPDIDDPSTFLFVRNWLTSEKDEFLNDYIIPSGISHTMSFVLRDAGGIIRAIYTADKTVPQPFSQNELSIMRIIIPQLNNLFGNLFASHAKKQRIYQISWEYTSLTEREIEVADLLCKGIKPANISKRLNIAKSTTDKHIAHIYEKMNVTNCQELLVKLLNE